MAHAVRLSSAELYDPYSELLLYHLFKGGHPGWESLPPCIVWEIQHAKYIPGPPSPPTSSQERMSLLLLKVIYSLYSTPKSILFTALLVKGVFHFVLSPEGYPDNGTPWP